MKFSDYRRKRREEEQKATLSTKDVIPSVQYSNGSTGRTSKRFTDYMKERNPEGYNELQRRKAERTNNYIQQVNTHLDNNINMADTARKSLIFREGKYTPQEMADYNYQYQDEQDAIRREAFELMRQSWSMGDAGTDARNALKASLANVVDAGKNVSAVSDYMNTFEDKNSYMDAIEDARRKSAIERMSVDVIQHKIDETKEQLEGLQDHSLDDTALKGIKTLNGKDTQYQADKHSLENALHDYEAALFGKQQSEALAKLNEESLEAFKKYRDFQAEGPGTAKDIMSFVGLYDGRAREQDRKALEQDAKDALAKQGISEEEFDSLYEYYTFAYDADRAGQRATETQQKYDDANFFGKAAMNAGTVLTAPVRGITAGAEALNALTYVNEHAPLNVNSPAYDLTNYSDTVRNATSQGIDNNVANFLYQTGMSIADMAAILPVSTVSGGASLALMGTNAGTEAAKMATQRGASKEQALMTGLAAGGAEVIFEKVSLDHFWDIATKQGKAATKSMIANIFAQAGIEGTEEVATDLANMITDNLINGAYSEYHQSVDAYYKQGMSITEADKKATKDFIMGLGQSFFGGAISGGIFGSVGAVQTANRGKASNLTTDDYQRIVNTVNANEENGILQDYDMQVRETALDLMTKGDKATAFQKGLFEEQLIRTGYTNQNGDKLTRIEQIAADIPNKTISSAFVADYKQGMPIDTYTRAFNAFYNCGYTDMSFEQSMEKGANFEAFIDKGTLYSIWALGQNQAKEVSKVYASQEQRELVQMTAKALGVEVEFRDMVGTNGMYENGKLYIANQTINPSMVVLAHELTHDLKQNASAEYQQYEDYVINAFQEYHPQEYEALRKEIINQYGNDEAIIREEIVANASETFLTDADFVNKFVQENQTIAQRIVSFLDNFISKLRNLYKDYKAKGKAGKILESDIETYTNARELWYEAVKTKTNVNDSQSSTTRLSIKTLENGVKFVDVDTEQDLFQGKTPEECAKIAKKTILDKFSGTIIGEKDGVPIVATKRTAKEYSYAGKNYNKATAKAKMKASPELNNLLEVSEFIKHTDDVGKHEEAVGGFDYYKTLFRVNSRTFEGIINIMNTKNVSLLYDVTKIKELGENEFPTEDSSLASSTQLFNNIIADDSQNHNSKHSFKGVNAAENDLSALERAESMENVDEPEWKIFYETGWFRGADGKWRFEIDDSKAIVYRNGDAKMRNNEKYQKFKKMCVEGDFFNPEFAVLAETYGDIGECNHLTDYLVHDELYENYPFLRRIKINKKDVLDARGYFNEFAGEIGISKDLFGEYTEHVLKRTLLHEIQHAIQAQEKFAGGANIDTWSEVSIKKNQVKHENALRVANEAFEKGSDEFKNLVRKVNRLQIAEDFGAEYEAAEQELYDKYSELYSEYDDAMFEARLYLDSEELSNQEKYRMTAGEIEARDVSERMDMTEEERRNKMPTRETENGVIFAENWKNPFVARFSMKAYSEDIGLRFSEKDDFDLFLDIINGTDDIDYDSVLMDSESAPESTTGRLIYDAGKILKEGIKAAGSLKDVNVTMDVARSLATHYLNQYNATFDEETLAENIYNIFAYIQKSENVNYNDMIRVMQEVCKPVLATSQMVDKDIQKQYNDMKKVIKSYNIRLNESQKAEIARVYDSYDRFRRLNQDKYVLREKGVYLDSIWSELVDASGGMLAYDVPDANQMLELHDFMMKLKDSMVSIDSEMNNSQLAYDMALNLYTDYFRVISQDKEIINNIRTQMQKKLTEYKKDVKREYKDQYKKALEEEQLRQQASIKRLQNQIKEITLERDEALRTTEGATIDILNGEIVKLEKRIEKMKESNLKKIATLNTKHRESLLGRAQRNERSVVRNRIKKNMLDLQGRLAKPKENKYIPKQLVMVTIDLCEAVNIDTGKSQKLAEHLQNLALVYERLKGDADYVLASEYDEHTHGKIRRLQTIFSGRNITVLNMEELYEVDKLVSQLKHQITNAAVVIGKENAKNIYEQAEQCMNEINATEGVKGDIFHRLIHKYNTSALNAKRQFRRMSGYKDDSVLNQMYEDLNEGSHRQMQVLMETARMFDGVLSGGQQQKAVRNMVGQLEQDWVEMDINLHGVEPVKVPKAFRVSLAMHIQNKSNLDHIIYGGLTIPEPNAYQRGDYKTAYATGHTIRFIPSGPLTPAQRQEAYNFAVRKLNKAVAEMTPYERQFLAVSEQFFHRYTGEKINEVSLQLNGYKKAVVNKYFPIRTDSNFTHAELEGLVRNGSIEGMGFLNSRVGARNPILLEDITKVIQRQSENVAKYYGFAIPIRNFNKIYNTTKFGYRDSTKSVIARKWGVEGQKYIENLLIDIQSHRGQEGTFFDKLQGNFAQAVLTSNLSVAAQQIVAYPTAAATLGWDAVIKGMKYIPSKLDMDHIAKYTPLLWYRNRGTGADEIGDVGKNRDAYQNMASKLTGWLDSKDLKALAKVSGWGEDRLKDTMDVLQKIDTKAVGSLWKASEIFVEEQMHMSVKTHGEDAFYKQVAKVFNECVDDTQANYSTMQRPDILRKPNTLYKAVFMFKTQPLQNFGIIYDAVGNLRAKNEELKVTNLTDEVRKKLESARDESAKTLARAVSSQLAAAGLIFVLKFLAAAITHRVDKYRGDDGDLAADRILEEGFNEVMSNLSGSVLFGSEIYNFLYSAITKDTYYGISVGPTDSLNDLLDSTLRYFKDSSAKNLRSLIFDIGTVIGIPAENLYKTVNGAGLHLEDFINGEPLSFNAGYTGSMSAYYKVMYESLASGDSKEYKKVYDKALEQQLLTKTEDEAKSAITAGIKSKLKESYIAGEISDDQALQILNTLGDDDAYFTIKAWDNADNEEYSKYSELAEAVRTGKNIDTELQELIDNGVKEKTAIEKLIAAVKEGWKDGTISDSEASKYLKEYKSDFTDEDVYWELRKWSREDTYAEGESYSRYDDLVAAVENGTFDTVVKEYAEHGLEAKDIKRNITSAYKEQYMEAYRSKQYKLCNEIKDKLNILKVKGKRLFGQPDYLDWNKDAIESK